jgi:hypothetical protein
MRRESAPAGASRPSPPLVAPQCLWCSCWHGRVLSDRGQFCLARLWKVGALTWDRAFATGRLLARLRGLCASLTRNFIPGGTGCSSGSGGGADPQIAFRAAAIAAAPQRPR